jgi:hypothetical protein
MGTYRIRRIAFLRRGGTYQKLVYGEKEFLRTDGYTERYFRLRHVRRHSFPVSEKSEKSQKPLFYNFIHTLKNFYFLVKL